MPGTLRYRFKGSELLTEYYSQVCQDLFILSVLGGKRDGTYLEIGAYYPDFLNNTYILSRDFNWSGISVDINTDFSIDWAIKRPKDRLIIADALTMPYREILKSNFGDNRIIDYLQLDIDPASKTLTAMFNAFRSGFKFRVITFETDLYNGNPVACHISRDFLPKFGYTCIAKDVFAGKDEPFEDWWVDLNLVNKEVALDIMNISKDIKYPKEFLFIN